MSYAVRADGGWRAVNSIDDLVEGETWSEVQPPVPEPPAPSVTSVTMRQARLALFSAGKLNAVPAAISALPEPQRTEAQINWDYASHVEKTSPLIQTLAPAIGLDAAAVTELFNHAATL